MKKIVDTMYAKILADPFLAPFFTGINMALLKHQQEKVCLGVCMQTCRQG